MSKPKHNLPPAAQILIIRFSAWGDVVACTFLPRIIKASYPQAKIYVVTKSEYADLWSTNPAVKQVFSLKNGSGINGLLALIKQLKQYPWDLVIDAHKSLRSRLLTLCLKGHRSDYSKRTWRRELLIKFNINLLTKPYPKQKDFVSGLERFNIVADNCKPELCITHLDVCASFQSKHQRALLRLQEWQSKGYCVIGFAPFASWPLKIWPHYEELMGYYLRWHKARGIIFGGSNDMLDNDKLDKARLDADKFIDLSGKLSYIEAAWFIAKCAALIGNDSGAVHVAEAVQQPALVLLGPTTSMVTGYYMGQDSQPVVLEHKASCRPCTRMGRGACSNPYYQACLASITPEQVLSALSQKVPMLKEFNLRA